MVGLLRAQKGELSPSIISPGDLKEIINWTLAKHYHRPIVRDTLQYYNLAHVTVMDGVVVVVIPFDREEKFEFFSITPFPMHVNNTPIIWDHEPFHMLYHQRSGRLVEVREKPMETCVEVFDIFYCNLLNIQLPIQMLPCLRSIITDSPELSHACKYVQYDQEFYYNHLEGDRIIYSNHTISGSMQCKSKQQTITIKNVRSLSAACEIRLKDRFGYVPSKLFQYSLNHSYVTRNFSSRFTEPEISQIEIKVRKPLAGLPSPWFTNMQYASPYMSIGNVLLFVCVFACIFIIRCVFNKKLSILHGLIVARNESSSH